MLHTIAELVLMTMIVADVSLRVHFWHQYATARDTHCLHERWRQYKQYDHEPGGHRLHL
jgi:hypothetical protein